MGSSAFDGSGDLALGYSESSSSIHPSIAIAGRVPTDPPSTLESEIVVLAGTGSQTDPYYYRWGDYSAMSLDPTDDCTFWYTQEYIKTNGSFNWDTRIVNFKFPGCLTGSTASVTSTLNPSTYGQAVSFTATVASITSEGGATPTGSVQFAIDGTNFGSPVTLSGSSATLTNVSTLAEGTHTITAAYAGDTNFSPTTGTLTGGQVVNLAAASVSVASNLNPSIFGQSVTFTATISGEFGLVKGRKKLSGKRGAHPDDVSGSVTWSANTGCGETTVTTGNPGVATCITSVLPLGTDIIEADYSGDSSHSGSSGTLSGGEQVNPPTVNVTAAANPTGLSFSVDGTTYSSAQNFTWNVGDQHTLATTTPQYPRSGVQETFVNWSDGTTSTSDKVTATAGTTSYKASFNAAYQLTTSANPTAGGTVTPTSGAYYAPNAVREPDRDGERELRVLQLERQRRERQQYRHHCDDEHAAECCG